MPSLLEQFDGKRVLIIGDLILDEYLWGEVSRISAEAPVPIVRLLRKSYRPGGAGNVAANIASLGGVPLLGGVIGADGFAEPLRNALVQAGVCDTSGLVADPERVTTVKSRIVAHNQQMLRLDTEESTVIPQRVEALLCDWCEAQVGNADALVVSDYAKGVVSASLAQTLMRTAQAQGKPVIVDPKGRDYTKYRGATLVTPNSAEATLAAGHIANGDGDLAEMASHLLDILGGADLLVTEGARGMTLYRPGQAAVHITAQARNVYDVSGAGDTVIATLALALAAGADTVRAAHLANASAGVVVGKFGTATVTRDELAQAIEPL